MGGQLLGGGGTQMPRTGRAVEGPHRINSELPGARVGDWTPSSLIVEFVRDIFCLSLRKDQKLDSHWTVGLTYCL